MVVVEIVIYMKGWRVQHWMPMSKLLVKIQSSLPFFQRSNPHFQFLVKRGVSIPNTTKMSSTDKEDNRTVGEQTTTACTELGEWVNETAM